MKYFLGSYNFFQYVFLMILYVILLILAKLTFLTTRVVPMTLSKNIFETRDNATFSKLLSIRLLFAGVKSGGREGGELDRERFTFKRCG